jgi:predicted DNA-binding transcriptional regulator YafY
MARNAEVTRQWKILLEIQAPPGRTIDQLAKMARVCTRTIRRDLRALQDAGFALYDQPCEDGGIRWRLQGHPLRWLEETSFTVSELAALYFSRTLLECAVDRPFQADLKAAFTKLEHALPPHMRAFLEQLPQVLTAKRGAVRHGGKTPGRGETVSRLMEATLSHRKAVITYYSFSSRRVKDYAIEPYRLAYGNGGFYLYGLVREYGQMRTFAIERIRKLSVLEETFSPIQQAATEPFVNSLGVHSGKPEHVEIEFTERVAPYIEERTWHPSQKLTRRPDGSILFALDVCLDWALSSWILGFGPFARVLSPPTLAEQILEEIEEARDVYTPRLAFGPAPLPRDTGSQHVLPLWAGAQPDGRKSPRRRERQLA